jgi:hypothetical protein
MTFLALQMGAGFDLLQSHEMPSNMCSENALGSRLALRDKRHLLCGPERSVAMMLQPLSIASRRDSSLQHSP